MATVLDVAAYMLSKCGAMPALKLQKLVYYAQAWSLVWDDKPLFKDRIEAWAHGPVAPRLYRAHRGAFEVSPGDISGNLRALDKDGHETVDAVIKFYGDKSAQWLSDLTHQESPWRNARIGLAPGQPGDKEITHEAMAEYYSSLK